MRGGPTEAWRGSPSRLDLVTCPISTEPSSVFMVQPHRDQGNEGCPRHLSTMRGLHLATPQRQAQAGNLDLRVLESALAREKLLGSGGVGPFGPLIPRPLKDKG